MKIHLIAVEVRIERRTTALVESKRTMRLNDRIERHNTKFVKTRLSVEQHYIVVD